MGTFLQYLAIGACGLFSLFFAGLALATGFRLIAELYREKDWSNMYFMIFAMVLVSMVIDLIP
jgi:uncharacterized membrane protein YcjF (UPF0283 family)